MPPVGVQDWCLGAQRLFLFLDSELNKLQIVCPWVKEEIFGLVLNSVHRKLYKLNMYDFGRCCISTRFGGGMRIWEYSFETLHLEFKMDALWQQCYLNCLCNSLSLFTAFLLWLVMHYMFYIGIKYQTHLADLSHKTLRSVVKSKVLSQVLKTEAVRVLDIFSSFTLWKKKEWYTKQVTELGAYSKLLLTLTIKTKKL